MKTCRTCARSLPVGEFYRHSGMRGGRVNHCKDCQRRAARVRRRKEPSAREYDRARAKTPKRKAGAVERTKKWREGNRDAMRAHNAVARALRAGKIVRRPCEDCGSEKVHAHHRDYSRPTDVIWLCAPHHHRAHGRTRPPVLR